MLIYCLWSKQEDLEVLIAEFRSLDAKKTQVVETVCAPPSSRCVFMCTAVNHVTVTLD